MNKNGRGGANTQTEKAVELIRLYFPVPEEEQRAVSLTTFLGQRAGPGIVDLRPDMSMSKVLELAGAKLWTTAEVSRLLELAGIDAFDEQFEQMTFREFVRYSVSRSPNSGS